MSAHESFSRSWRTDSPMESMPYSLETTCAYSTICRYNGLNLLPPQPMPACPIKGSRSVDPACWASMGVYHALPGNLGYTGQASLPHYGTINTRGMICFGKGWGVTALLGYWSCSQASIASSVAFISTLTFGWTILNTAFTSREWRGRRGKVNFRHHNTLSN